MADVQGGLNAVSQEPVEQPVVQEQVATPEEAVKTDAVTKLQQQRAKYDAHLQKMIDSFNERQNRGYDPKLLSFAAGMGQPTKTGNFFEALSNAMTGYKGASEQEEKDRLEMMKAKGELMAGQIGLTEKDYALQKELEGKQFLQDVVSGKYGKKPQAGTIIGREEKLTVPDAYALINEASTGGAKITPEIIAAAPTKETQALLEKLYDDQQKSMEISQKELGTTKKPIPYLNETVDLSVKQARDIDTLIARTQGMPEDTRKKIIFQYYKDQGIGSFGEATDGKTTFETPAEKQKRLEVEKVKGTKQAEQDIADATALQTRHDSAMETMRDANTILNFATDPATKNAFGILSRPGLKSAFGEILREPARFGNTSVGMANIENVIRKAGGTQDEINAAQTVARYISKLELGASQVFKGQGQVSDNERLIVRNVVPSLSDSPEVAALKAESIAARSEYDQVMFQQYQKYLKNNPNGSVREFETTPLYKSINEAYDTKLGALLNKYGYQSAKSKESKATTKGSLWDSLKQQQSETP
jgi:hypothetical protein